MSGILPVLVFEEPPPPYVQKRGGRPRTTWREALAPLLAHPGKWAKLAEYEREHVAQIMASNLRGGVLELPPGRWEFAQRDRRIYARHLGKWS